MRSNGRLRSLARSRVRPHRVLRRRRTPIRPSSRTRRTTRSRSSTPTSWRSSRPSRSASGRAASICPTTTSGCSSARATTTPSRSIDTKTYELVKTLPSGPDPELFVLHPSGNPLYVANEDDNLVTVVDINYAARSSRDIPVGVEPEGMGMSPDGKVLVNTSETTNMAHFIDTATHKIVDNVLVDSRPRVAGSTRGTQLWVSSEVGGTRHRHRSRRRARSSARSTSRFPGSTGRRSSPSASSITKDDKLAFVALGPANRVAVVDTATSRCSNICWSASASGTWPSRPTTSTC